MNDEQLDELEARLHKHVLHDMAKPGPDHNYDRDGDYVLNADGSKRHADDCRGCAHDEGVAQLIAVVRAAQEMRGYVRSQLAGMDATPELTYCSAAYDDTVAALEGA